MNRNGGSESVDCTTGSPLAREACSSDACKLVSETGLVDVIATGLSFDFEPVGGGTELCFEPEACSSGACRLVVELVLVDVGATGLSFDPGGGVEGGTRLHPGLSLPFRKTAADSVPA